MAQPRYITTLVQRLNQAYREEPKFDYGDSDRGRAIKEQIADAMTFWRFYENLREHLTNIKNLPEDINVLRHELLKRIAAEDTFRGFIACWLRLPPTVIETLKWSQNLDIQSRESFLRRLEFRQLQSVREAYDEFFEHRLVPTCMSDGVFRRIVHRHVTYETLKAEPLISRNRAVSKCAWGKNYAHMDFGHARYPQGPADDVADSGAFRKFFSVKNHANDFAVNQHDGLYWFLYRTLRSNYIWNRNGDVELQRIDPQVVVKRNAYMNALRKAGEGESSYLNYLIDNDWVINHDDPVRIGREIRLFVDRLTGGLEGATMLRYKGAQVIDAGTAKRFDAYTHEVVMSAYSELGSRYYSEFVLRAYEGYTPEQALQKAIKLKEQIQGKRTFWHESFPMRMLDKFLDFFEAIWYGIGKVFKDLFGMWRLLHKYCPAVAETKDI